MSRSGMARSAASFMRSSRASVGSCQGKSSSTADPAGIGPRSATGWSALAAIARQLAPLAEAAADEDVIALDLAFARGDLRAEQPDVADVVLRAGMRTAGEMDVERLVDGDARVEMVGER